MLNVSQCLQRQVDGNRRGHNLSYMSSHLTTGPGAAVCSRHQATRRTLSCGGGDARSTHTKPEPGASEAAERVCNLPLGEFLFRRAELQSRGRCSTSHATVWFCCSDGRLEIIRGRRRKAQEESGRVKYKATGRGNKLHKERPGVYFYPLCWSRTQRQQVIHLIFCCVTRNF